MKYLLRSLCFASVLLSLHISHVSAQQLASVADQAILYDTPSEKGKKLFTIMPGTPIEIIVRLESFSKVRTAEGYIDWIRNSDINNQRTVIVTVDATDIKSEPQDDAQVLYHAKKNDVFVLDGSLIDKWQPIRLENNIKAYIPITCIWGA